MNGIKRFLDQRGKRFWWTVRFVFVGLIAFAIFTLGWIGGADYVTNIYTELIGVIIGIGFTVVFVDRHYANREEKRTAEELKRRLVREAGSRSNAIAVAAIEHLHANDWLADDDGLLRNARLDYAELLKTDLRSANLELAWLWRANLNNVDLFGANLKGAYLSSANLQADLRYANLQEAIMSFANLRGSRLTHANLRGADLTNAYLQHADMRAADLQGALLAYAKLEEATLSTRSGNDDIDQQFAATLPDGSLHTEDVDLAKFTDPNHPEFEAMLEKTVEIRRAHSLDNRLPPIS